MIATQFLSWVPERRGLLFDQVAAARNVHPVIVEKDFWVCWLLELFFSQKAIGPHIVFKGGTSLSKVFGVIDRFSEDLSLSPEFVGADLATLERLDTNQKFSRAIREMQLQCGEKVEKLLSPILEDEVSLRLGIPVGQPAWLHYKFEEESKSPTLYFRYPTVRTERLEYVRQEVKVEMGSLTDQQPTGIYSIRPWVAEDYGTVFSDWKCEVRSLELARSFWEKATILHSEYYRPSGQPTPLRYSRHYSDVARLLVHPDASTFIRDDALCRRVAEWKSRTFPRKWAMYDDARRGSLRLVPEFARRQDLKDDYRAMRQMFLSEPDSFETIMDQLASAEEKINSD